MKNNKGLTLVELLAVLIVLSLIVMIVVPSVTRNLKLSKIQMCELQLDSLISASKNWLTDQIDIDYDNLFSGDQFLGTSVNGKTLLDDGYVSELDADYYDVKINISKDGNNYIYEIENKEQYCK